MPRGEAERPQLKPIRTAAEIVAHIPLWDAYEPPLYQKIAKKVVELHALNKRFMGTARSLGVPTPTVIKGYKYRNR